MAYVVMAYVVRACTDMTATCTAYVAITEFAGSWCCLSDYSGRLCTSACDDAVVVVLVIAVEVMVVAAAVLVAVLVLKWRQ